MTTDPANVGASFVNEFLEMDVSDQVSELTKDDIPHPKPGRMRSIDTNLFFKGIRQNGNKRCRDLFCDLLCANLGQRLDIPTPPQVAVDHSALGIGLISPFLTGTNGIAVTDYNDLVNTEDVPLLCIFEEWVMNTDDKTKHFWTVATGDGPKLYIVDHGHTLHRANNFGDPDAVSDHAKIHQSVGKSHYYFDTVDAVRPGVSQIQQLKDEGIADMIDQTVGELQALEAADADMQTFLDEADEHQQTVLNVLTERRDHLDTIMHDKFV